MGRSVVFIFRFVSFCGFVALLKSSLAPIRNHLACFDCCWLTWCGVVADKLGLWSDVIFLATMWLWLVILCIKYCQRKKNQYRFYGQGIKINIAFPVKYGRIQGQLTRCSCFWQIIPEVRGPNWVGCRTKEYACNVGWNAILKHQLGQSIPVVSSYHIFLFKLFRLYSSYNPIMTSASLNRTASLATLAIVYVHVGEIVYDNNC